MKGDKSGRKGQLSVATEVNRTYKIEMITSRLSSGLFISTWYTMIYSV